MSIFFTNPFVYQSEQKKVESSNTAAATPVQQTIPTEQIAKADIIEVETLGAETELTSTDTHDDKDDVTSQLSSSGMRTRSHR